MWQGNIDWQQVPTSGIAFAWLKTDESVFGYVDPQWWPNIAGATAAGIPWGGYHYAQPNQSDGATAARVFVGHGGMAGTLPGMLDLEETGNLDPQQLGQWAQDFLRTAQQLSGKTPILYVGAYFPADLNYVGWWPSYWPLMLPSYTAGYNVDVNPCWINQPRTPDVYNANGTGWDVWQYSSSGRVAGINGGGSAVDMNVITPEFFNAITGIGTAPAPVPPAQVDQNAPWQVYKQGSRGPGVVQLQQMLNDLGCDAGSADGVYGAQTGRAVSCWQTRLGLAPDGVWGTDTQQASDAFFAWLATIPTAPAIDPQLAAFLAFADDCTRTTLRQGSLDDCVALAQTLEANHGYWIDADSNFGSFTSAVTADFQGRSGLIADGIIGPATWAALVA
jgi:lysozyme